VAVVPPSSVRFDAGDFLCRRVSRDDADEQEPPRYMRRRSSSVDGEGHGPARHYGEVVVTTRPANSTQSKGRRARPCRRVVLSGNTRPGRKPRGAHTHGVDRGKAPRATNTSCVTGTLLARVEGREATLTPRPLIPSVPLRTSEIPPQTPSKNPQKTLPSGHMGVVDPARTADGV